MRDEIQVIEKTSKRWKAVQAIGVAIIALGVVLCMVGSQEPANSPSDFSGMLVSGVLVALAGFAVYGTGRVIAWWNHG